ncbi:macrophage colony-stimulating factor 1 isoform X3 [Pipistrellus kuhlii]|uniref:macrophage colony-stimulating factor 1 isoform X3 n=1 Tax=Pipistrellus kuhlii TaxID=59472 RepID=UPI001E273496|nr:macrophage colony-stimulating factor 1 isoform X3 [Pipistrellus kuhlii]
MPKSLKRPCRGAGRRSRRESESSPGAPGAAAGSPHSRDSGAASAGRGLRGGRRASEQARAAEAPGRDPAARMTARGAAGRCPPTTWLGPRLLLVCLLVNRSITEEESKHCSHMIGDGHLQLLQQMIDSQMETGCKIPFQFVNEDQLEDRVCYIKKAFSLAQDIMQETISFKDNTANAIALVKLLELSVRLKDCFPQVSEEHDTACVQNFSESPLWALEKIKNVFNETKNLLKTNQSIFSKNCSDSFAKCSGTSEADDPAPSTSPVLRPLLLPGGGVMLVLVLLAVGGLLLHRRRQRSHRELWIMDSSREQPEGSPLAQPEDRRVETPV